MQVEIAAGEIRQLTVGRVTVQPVLLRTVSDPVLDDCDHAGGIDTRRAVLKSFDVRLHQCAREIDVFAEGAVDARSSAAPSRDPPAARVSPRCQLRGTPDARCPRIAARVPRRASRRVRASRATARSGPSELLVPIVYWK